VDPSWYADTGATDHLTNELDKLHVKEPYHGQESRTMYTHQMEQVCALLMLVNLHFLHHLIHYT
jgi:hypothetical protein